MSKMIARISALIIATTLLSCNRQELVDPYKYLAYIPVSTDWSDSQLDMSEVGNVSIYFYPTGGGEPVIKISNNLNFNLVELPVGEYSVLIFNDMVDNIKGVNFSNESSYDNFSVGTIEEGVTLPTFYAIDSSVERLATQHSRVASWSMDEFTVDETMIEYTRSTEFDSYIAEVRSRSESRGDYTSSKSDSEGASTRVELPESKSVEVTKAMTKSLEELSNVEVAPLTTIVNISVRVINLNNAMTIETVLKGTASGSYFTQEQNISDDGRSQLYFLEVSDREYDDPTNGIDGYINFSHNTFGRVAEDEEYTLFFDITTQTGDVVTFERDITDAILTNIEENCTIEIDLEVENDGVITLDPYEEAGFSVDGWEDDVTLYL